MILKIILNIACLLWIIDGIVVIKKKKLINIGIFQIIMMIIGLVLVNTIL